ncbi:pyruvate formate-lyase activating enzyme [Bifidobacterium bombi DSM 19703]|uniref:Pyruvate formate-lyase-activating enzyme n=2 Tax=Bifidobacterium bombi TaxID=471511 RepID=A0A080N1W6_9BIFI|nr:pyruvate formate-lyase activating enzyme [Bifidobacterium bombi DSM 19703]
MTATTPMKMETSANGSTTRVEVSSGASRDSENTGFRTTTPHMLKTSKVYAKRALMGGLSGFRSPVGMDRRDRVQAMRTGDIGFVHSWDINTSVDGPGTRMTVFMSGCPLRCQFCQNPDTWKMRDGKPVYLDDMVGHIVRYKDIFQSTGGGVTVSGGESMMQAAFVSRVFHAVKKEGVGTCLDTSGFLGRSWTDEMLEDVDMCLLDVKSGDEETYHRVTGAALAPTIEFGERYARLGKRIWVRFVLVPGLTDSVENVENVAKICERFGDAVEHIDVLGFHQLGRPKWHELRIPYPLETCEGPSRELKDRVRQQFRDHGFVVY